MSSSYEYATLISSLPKVEHWSIASRPSISNYQLNKRFSMLSEADFSDITILVTLLDQSTQPLTETDAQYLEQCSVLVPKVIHPKIADMIVWRLEFRSIVAALRHKYFRKDVSGLQRWGYGRWSVYIPRYWQDKYLGLSQLFPWVVTLVDAMESDDPVAAEKIILNNLWHWLEHISLGHQFDVEAVAIYRMRWEIVNYWTTTQNEKDSQQTFEQLLTQALNKVNT